METRGKGGEVMQKKVVVAKSAGGTAPAQCQRDLLEEVISQKHKLSGEGIECACHFAASNLGW